MGHRGPLKEEYEEYAARVGRVYDHKTDRATGQTFTSSKLDPSLDPNNFEYRECCACDEHPNPIPVFLCLDTTGSMGDSCKETAETLGAITLNLYKKFENKNVDIEFCIMGIGDLAYWEKAPIQMSQIESDVRIIESIDKLWLEKRGGTNPYESYTAAWYMCAYHTKLDTHKQGRKGIIITMGDEPLNPYLPLSHLRSYVKKLPCQLSEEDLETKNLYKKASEGFDIFHIAVDDDRNCYSRYRAEIKESFGEFLGDRLKVSSINGLQSTIESCIEESVLAYDNLDKINQPATETPTNQSTGGVKINEYGEITW